MIWGLERRCRRLCTSVQIQSVPPASDRTPPSVSGFPLAASPPERALKTLKGGPPRPPPACHSEVFYSKAFKAASVKKAGNISGKVRLDTGIDFLEMDLQYSQIDDNKSIFICYSEYKDIGQSTFEKLSAIHKAKKSLSKKLLDMCDCPYETVIGNKTKGTIKFMHSNANDFPVSEAPAITFNPS